MRGINDGSPEERARVTADAQRVQAELHRQEVTAELRERSGLHYASVTDERTGPHVVVHDGTVLGEVYTTSPGVFADWFTRPLSGESRGPFPSARAAAAAMLKA